MRRNKFVIMILVMFLGLCGMYTMSIQRRFESTTILMMGYSPKRKVNYPVIFKHYTDMSTDIVDSVVLVWCHPTEPPPRSNFDRVSILKSDSPSLNSRWSHKALEYIHTDTVMSVDDDLLIPEAMMIRMLKMRHIYRNDDRLVGLDHRYVSSNLEYVSPGYLSRILWPLQLFVMPSASIVDIVLTKTMIVPTRFLRAYESEKDIITHVDSVKNCEDIGMNVVSRRHGAAAPIALMSIEIPMKWFQWTGIGHTGYVRWTLPMQGSAISRDLVTHQNTRDTCVRTFEQGSSSFQYIDTNANDFVPLSSGQYDLEAFLFLCVALVILVSYFFLRRRRKGRTDSSPPPSTAMTQLSATFPDKTL